MRCFKAGRPSAAAVNRAAICRAGGHACTPQILVARSKMTAAMWAGNLWLQSAVGC